MAGELKAFCRDCFAPQAADSRRCTACASPRILAHPELDRLAIAHIDCDAFYAAVEKRDNPDLRDKPVIIGGGKRGVASTACYIARMYGVKSAMPMFKALQLCPQAVVVRPDMDKYVKVGHEVRALMQSLTPLVEPLSLDEAFLDLTGTERVHRMPPALTLAKLARRIEEDQGITVSIGLSYCKFLAKLSSDLRKPRGFTVIGRAEAVEFLAPRRVSDIFGVGKAMLARLEGDGLDVIGKLSRIGEEKLTARYGSIGRRLYRFSRGEDDRRISPERETKSISAETTFNEDTGDFAVLKPRIWRLAEKVARRSKAANLAGQTVTLKLKTADFRLRSRSITLSQPTQLAETIYRAVEPLLRAECTGAQFRLAGVGISHLGPPTAPSVDLLGGTERTANVEGALDKVRAKFGNAAIIKGRSLDPNSGAPDKSPGSPERPSARSRRSPEADRN